MQIIKLTYFNNSIKYLINVLGDLKIKFEKKTQLLEVLIKRGYLLAMDEGKERKSSPVKSWKSKD